MENNTIPLKEALQIFNRRDVKGMLVPFDITYRTFSTISKSGGELKNYQRVKYLPPANPEEDKQVTIYNVFDPVKGKRDPKHHENRTRNIELATGEIRKLNIDYIITVNNLTVIY